MLLALAHCCFCIEISPKQTFVNLATKKDCGEIAKLSLFEVLYCYCCVLVSVGVRDCRYYSRAEL